MGGIKNLLPKIKNILGKAKSSKSVIFHIILVLVLLYFLVWQTLNFYSFSTHNNITNAIKTKHMLVIDLATGKSINHFPKPALHEDVATEHKEPAPNTIQEASAEIAVILAGIEDDEAYNHEIFSLPSHYVFSFNPSSAKAITNSLRKNNDGAYVISQISAEQNGKFDVKTSNSDFKNNNNSKAALSKVYDANGLLIYSDQNFINSSQAQSIANSLAEKQIPLISILPSEGLRNNIIHADIYIPKNTAHDEVLSQLAKLEEISLSSGYALVVIDPVPELKKILDEWSKTLAAKKIKLTPILKN